MSIEVSAYCTWSCNYDHQKKLVNALLNCTNLLSTTLSWPDIKSGDTKQQQVVNLIEACLRYPGRIEWLVDDLFSYERDSQPMLKVFAVLDQIIKLPLPWEKVTRLKSLLTEACGVPNEQALLNICGKCFPSETLPTEVFQEPKERDTLVYLIDWLVRKGRLSTSKIPILEFVKRVTPDSNALDNWVNDVAKYQFQLTQEEINQLGNDPVCRPPKPLSCHLLIKLDQANPNLDAYHVQAWLAKNAEKAPSIIYSSSEAKPLAEIAQVVDNILNSIVHKQFAITDRELTIEFFLPKELLCHPVDQWIIDPEIDETLGSRYRLVIRSSERFENDKLLNRLKGHWQVNINILQTSPKECMICLHQEEDKGVRGHLGQGQLFFTLKFVPSPKFLFKLIQFGVPFILWPRQLNRPEEIEEVDRLLSCSNCATLKQLPEVLRQERFKIIDKELDKQSMTYHLSLLWDDPDRIPDFKLEAPT